MHAVRKRRIGTGGRWWALRDGFDGLLFPERYRDGGVLVLDPATTPGSDDEGSLLGTGTRNDPFRLQEPNEDGLIEEVDASERQYCKCCAIAASTPSSRLSVPAQ